MDKAIIILLIIILVFLLGWLFPVEGPFDYAYDDYVKPKPKFHGSVAPAPKRTIIYEDYNEDGEPEWYQIVPMFEVKDE